uniref:Uncharacterized protein n=1 Tax=Compsopogon caeruleus TaxID=31354 RepID=A0A7S1T9L5_9RHOD|mmetsp:Transcript_1330/g.2783  ORF Transcript_1330/g.2783 Transcript_1330/m.2783 type:complete len:179 (+) Transcript_1330:69-605(+)
MTTVRDGTRSVKVEDDCGEDVIHNRDRVLRSMVGWVVDGMDYLQCRLVMAFENGMNGDVLSGVSGTVSALGLFFVFLWAGLSLMFAVALTVMAVVVGLWSLVFIVTAMAGCLFTSVGVMVVVLGLAFLWTATMASVILTMVAGLAGLWRVAAPWAGALVDGFDSEPRGRESEKDAQVS